MTDTEAIEPTVDALFTVHGRRMFIHARKHINATFLDVFENHMCGPRDYLRLRLEETLRELQSRRVVYRWEADVTDVGKRRELKKAVIDLWLHSTSTTPVTLTLDIGP